MAPQMSGSDHHPNHPDVTADCPMSCLGVHTVGDLIALLTSTARSAIPDNPSPAWPPHEQHSLTCPISCLKLSARITNALRHHDTEAENIGQLIHMLQHNKLGEVRNIGPRRLSEVHTALVAEGFNMGYSHPT